MGVITGFAGVEAPRINAASANCVLARLTTLSRLTIIPLLRWGQINAATPDISLFLAGSVPGEAGRFPAELVVAGWTGSKKVFRKSG